MSAELEKEVAKWKKAFLDESNELAKRTTELNDLHDEYAILAEKYEAAIAAQAQQPTEEPVNKLRYLADQCKVAASCLTYNGARAEAVAKHLLLEASQGLRRSQAQQEPLKVSENWREPLSADAMQRLKNLGVLDKPLPPAPEGDTNHG